MSVIELRKESLVSPSSSLLDMHLEELEEECARFLSLIAALRSMSERPETANEDERATIEGELYASVSHMNNHVGPALSEMDQLLDAMPDDDEESNAD